MILPISIRPAAPHHADALARLAAQLGYPATPDQIRERLARAASSPDRFVLVAEIDVHAVAWMELAVRHALESGSWAEITGLVVAEDSRARGIGTALVEHAARWARDRGQSRLRVRTNTARAAAHAFYESRGFRLTKTQRVYELSVEAGAAT